MSFMNGIGAAVVEVQAGFRRHLLELIWTDSVGVYKRLKRLRNTALKSWKVSRALLLTYDRQVEPNQKTCLDATGVEFPDMSMSET